MSSAVLLDPYKVLQVLPTAEDEVIRAAYRALALKYHPDRDSSIHAGKRIRELNTAYEMVRDPASRARLAHSQRFAAFSSKAQRPQPNATVNQPNGERQGSEQLSFGRYAGWSLKDVARHDPDYLRWLSRHSSGIGYRTKIQHVLSSLGLPAA